MAFDLVSFRELAARTSGVDPEGLALAFVLHRLTVEQMLDPSDLGILADGAGNIKFAFFDNLPGVGTDIDPGGAR